MSSKTFETLLGTCCSQDSKKYALLNDLDLKFWQHWTLLNEILSTNAVSYCLQSRTAKKIPREFQLKAVLALLSGQDTLIDAGTGSGKTVHDPAGSFGPYSSVFGNFAFKATASASGEQY
jgi:hypothetical protein